MLLQMSNKLGVVAWFKINQKKIVELFCINKDKPEMACDGKCYLKDKLEKVDDSENNQNKSSNPNNQQTKEEYLITSNIHLDFKLLTQKKNYFWLNNLYHFKFSPRYFHPPQV